MTRTTCCGFNSTNLDVVLKVDGTVRRFSGTGTVCESSTFDKITPSVVNEW
jgi:hypothetical protein